MSYPDNPRAVIGSNTQADNAAAAVTDYLRQGYRLLSDEVTNFVNEANTLPLDIGDDDEAAALNFGARIKRGKDLSDRIEAYRKAEKEPHLRSVNAVDAYFFSMIDMLARRQPKNKPGILDLLQGAVSDWMDRKRRKEELARRQRAEEEARKAREAADRALKLEAEAQEARAKEERARKAENREAARLAAEEVERKRNAAEAAAAAASDKAEEARIQTLAKPADMSRTRGDDGVLLTTKREGYVILTDRQAIDVITLERLLPYFTDADLEKAARQFAKATGHNKPLEGFEIGFRNKGVTR